MVLDQMNPVLYKAVVKGNVEDYHEALEQMPEEEARGRQVTPKGNTVLHVAAINGHKHLVEEILQDDDAAMSLLFAKNNRNQSALHCVAEKGYAGVVSVIFSAIKKHKDLESAFGRVREMIEMKDDVKDTALHKAVRMGHLEVAKLLIQEDPEFEYPANDDGETPIYIAAELRFHDCLVEMLNTCKKPTYGGPLGRNALHAAILSGLGNISKVKSTQEFSSECTQSLLEKKMCLCEETDKSGWTPLHYALKIENDKATCMILERKTSAAYICAGGSDEWTTTFHIAARQGNVEMMEEISNRCPDCWEMVNSKGQNVLHEAILSKKVNVIQHIEESSDQFENLVTHKDEDGNTPLHLLAITDRNIFFHQFITERPMLNYFAFNKKHQTLFDTAYLDIWDESQITGLLERRSRGLLQHSRKFAHRIIPNPEHGVNIHTMEKRLEAMITKTKTQVVVATLVLTMTFAAGITVPGGYHQEKGYPLLLRNAAFKAFIITNTLSFLCSFSSIAIHIGMVNKASSYSRSFEYVARLIDMQLVLLTLSCYGVLIAFMCAIYATLAPLRPLAIADLILGFFIFIFVYGAYFKVITFV
ncbi:protein ACCELERATED CELL DEATH 6-like [Ipomoea triloba]|uniref:protein ACCELERATED CELL DEATH 6-like n=1 Tax=Ipomoea triloba TaxID=35885 RepID=UPI00125DB6F4|nr:protein ACCELERATED CELL DEATH 6-like [Ipomoea triloba]